MHTRIINNWRIFICLFFYLHFYLQEVKRLKTQLQQNKKLNLFEEAEFGYRKAVEFGDYQLDTWLFWVDILQFLGEFESAIQTLLQASEYFPEENEVEYRLAGLYFMIQDITKAKFHLSNAMRLNFDNYILIEDLFPVVWARKMVQNYITKHKK